METNFLQPDCSRTSSLILELLWTSIPFRYVVSSQGFLLLAQSLFRASESLSIIFPDRRFHHYNVSSCDPTTFLESRRISH